jgi:hypothetical protein
MNTVSGFTVFDIAKDLGLAIEYSADLPPSVNGSLDPSEEPRFILVNANQPDFEQRFTIAHEIAHYLMHHNRPRRRYPHWFTDRKWNFKPLREISQRTRRAKSMIFTREWEADRWAVGLLVQLGDMKTLRAYLNRHPEKTKWSVIITGTIALHALPRLPAIFLKKLLKLFRIR